MLMITRKACYRGFLLLGCSAAMAEAVPFVALQNLTDSGLQGHFDTWTAAPYGYRLSKLSGCEVAGNPRYAAIFEKSTGSVDQVSRHGMSASAFTTYHAQVHASGYRLVWLDGFGAGGSPLYNGIWERTHGAPQRVRLGEPLAAHLSADETNRSEGFMPVDVCSFSVGGSSFHAGVWASGLVAVTEIRHGMSTAGYQNSFEELGGQGWHVHRVCGYEVSGLERFTALWKRSSPGEGWSHHGIRSEDFAAFQNNAQYLGYRPAGVDAYNIGTAVRYNAVWVRNGGLSTARLGTLATQVETYMTAHSLPGLSLAVACEGRLVYARGFGYADTASGEVADPLHRWRFASVSKPVCAVAALRALEDSAAWSLDSRAFGSGALFASDYGNTADYPYSANEKAVTLRQLLTMASGWNDDGHLWYNASPAKGTDHAAIISYQLDHQPQSFAPDTVYRYNNFNYQVAARIPEKITGMLFEDYCEQEIFGPCGITSMAVGNRTAASRLPREVSYYEGNVYGDPENVWPARMDGSTAWIGKPSDLLLMARRIDGHPRQGDIIGSYALSQMQLANGLPDEHNDPSTYGLGWYPSTRHGRTWWQHNGSMAGTQAILVVSDDGSRSFAYATNSVETGDRFSSQFRNMVIDWIQTVDTAGAWPETDHFGVWNPAYDAWADAAFGTNVTGRTGLLEVYAPSGDPDGDTRSNALEAFLGSDPETADRPDWCRVLATGDAVTLRWLRKTGNRGVVAVPQRSLNLENWTTYPVAIINRTDLISPVGSFYQEISLSRNFLERQFIRLNLTTP